MLNKLLVISPDEEDLQRSLTAYRKVLAEEVATFNTCKPALEYLKSHHPELIIFDINMPVDINCLFLHEYSQLPSEERGKCKIVAITDRNNAQKLKSLPLLDEIVAYEAKPLSQQRLEEIIQGL